MNLYGRCLVLSFPLSLIRHLLDDFSCPLEPQSMLKASKKKAINGNFLYFVWFVLLKRQKKDS